MMPSKPLRKPAPQSSAPAGTDRRSHRSRMALPAPGTSVTDATHLTSSNSPVGVHDPRVEDHFRTNSRFPSYSESEAVTACASQLRKMGDKLNLRQKILNLIAKLFCPGTGECLE
ncbi:phorbol-12-myristate-13-acetate-induced protein 1 [Eublepharis macularius]|uniref:Phorbol-12-myristate-13-acetate-induced protein 1 n=1 Tax=Eublepharis macularius TaxID=481883 RepID=A0AA97JTX1_EUBMA|nr:phorbol-12-myristate-13-acetate-induced protein 1 [Eublepharis macularius]